MYHYTRNIFFAWCPCSRFSPRPNRAHLRESSEHFPTWVLPAPTAFWLVEDKTKKEQKPHPQDHQTVQGSRRKPPHLQEHAEHHAPFHRQPFRHEEPNDNPGSQRQSQPERREEEADVQRAPVVPEVEVVVVHAEHVEGEAEAQQHSRHLRQQAVLAAMGARAETGAGTGTPRGRGGGDVGQTDVLCREGRRCGRSNSPRSRCTKKRIR